jgi:hypothetical protein
MIFKEKICRYEKRKTWVLFNVNIMSQTFNYFNGLTWDKVVWSNSYEKVRRIQKRIFKASKSGDKKRMWFLQKLLITNPHAKLIAVHIGTNNEIHTPFFGQSRSSDFSLKHSSTLGRVGKAETEADKRKEFRIEQNQLKEFSSEEKLLIARDLKINGKVNRKKVFSSTDLKTQQKLTNIKKEFFDSSCNLKETGPRNKKSISYAYCPETNLLNRAKQILCFLALEPEWKQNLNLIGSSYHSLPCPKVPLSMKTLRGTCVRAPQFHKVEGRA